jgi:hypothetical protein
MQEKGPTTEGIVRSMTPPTQYEELQKTAKGIMAPMIEQLAKYDISDEIGERVANFACSYFARYHKKMSVERIVRKVVEQFKLKPLKTEAE